MKFRSFAIFALIAASPAAAQEEARERPQALTRVLDCRAMQSDAERLACYDREVTALQQAEEARELVVLDRQQVRRTRRTLFGLTLPNLGLLGDDSPDQEGVTEIQSTLRSAFQNPYGKWILTLEDGARWIQLDGREFGREPRAGHPIRIRRAAMGSYLANIDNQTAIRVRRER